MKKTLAILLALALVFSSITVSFAAETLPVDAQACVDLGMIVGDGTGVTQSYLNTAPTRITAAVMVLNLKGLTDEAKAFTGTDNFADADKAAWAKPIMAYLKANPSVGYQGDGTNFNPTANITAKEYYVVMLTALGYKSGTDFTWDNVLTVAAEKGLKAVAGVTNFTVKDLATATVETLKANVAGGTTTLAAKLVADKVITAEAAAKAGVVATAATGVESVVAKSASSFVVKFNGPVADTTKAAITVKRNDVATAVTTAWNDTKTEATLTFAGILPEGDYVIGVKVDAADFGTKTVTITKQKIAKIEILGDSLSVAPPTTVVGPPAATKPGLGYATYKVFDQYGVDITSTPMANSNIGFNTSVGNGVGRNGLLTVTSFNDNVFLTQFPTATVTAYCTDSAVSATKSLTVSLAQGTLGDIALNKVTNVDNKEVKSNDTISKFYIDFTATDINGTPTKNWTLVTNGLLYSNNASKLLMTSNPTLLDARVTNDPADSNKAVIELIVRNGAIYQDTPVIITAMTKNGKSSSITVNVKKPSTLDKLIIMTPSVLVADNDTNVEIPYEAYDQNGNVLTKFEDILGTFSGGRYTNVPTATNLTFVRNADGTLKITTGNYDFDKGVPAVFQVVTSTGKSSMITIRPDEVAIANDLVVDATVIKQFMEKGAQQGLDFGPTLGWEGLNVLDQYGRKMNMVGAATDNYFVKATSSGTAVTVTNNAWRGNTILLDAVDYGTDTITFELIKKADNSVVSTKSASFTVVKEEDIVGIAIDEIPTLYATAGLASPDTAQVQDYRQTIYRYGKLANGSLVELNSTTLGKFKVFVDNSDFQVVGTKLEAKKLGVNVAEATGKLTGALEYNKTVYTTSVNVKSTSAAPVAASVGVSVSVSNQSDVADASVLTGVSMSGDTVKVKIGNIANVIGARLTKFDENGASTNRAKVYMYAKDQYGKTAMKLGDLRIIDQTTTNATYAINSQSGLLTVTAGTAQVNDTFTVAFSSTNGLTKIVKFVIVNN